MTFGKWSGYGVWAILALVAAAIAYWTLLPGPISIQQFSDNCYQRRARAFPAELPDAFKQQIIFDCEMQLRKSKTLR